MKIPKSFERLRKESILERFFIFLNTEYGFQKDISFEKAVKLFTASIPIFSLVYLYFFFNNFTVDYFIYFHPIDLIQVYYQQSILILILSVYLGLILLLFIITYLINSNKIRVNYISIVLLIIETYLLFQFQNKIAIWLSICLLILNAACYILRFSTKYIFYTLIVLQSCSAIVIGNYQAKNTLEKKRNFDILLNDDLYLLRENRNDLCRFFIGNTSNYLFVYDGFIEKVRAIPMKRIKEISFTPRKTLITQF